jgi:hypothetical protein
MFSLVTPVFGEVNEEAAFLAALKKEAMCLFLLNL